MSAAMLAVTLLGVTAAAFAVALVWHFPGRRSAWLFCAIACLLLWRVVVSWLYSVSGATVITDWSGSVAIPGAAGCILILLAFALTSDYVELRRLKAERDTLAEKLRGTP